MLFFNKTVLHNRAKGKEDFALMARSRCKSGLRPFVAPRSINTNYFRLRLYPQQGSLGTDVFIKPFMDRSVLKGQIKKSAFRSDRKPLANTWREELESAGATFNRGDESESQKGAPTV